MGLFRGEKIASPVLEGSITVKQVTQASATAGSATLPANPVAFITVTVEPGFPGGTPVQYKLPLYNV